MPREFYWLPPNWDMWIEAIDKKNTIDNIMKGFLVIMMIPLLAVTQPHITSVWPFAWVIIIMLSGFMALGAFYHREIFPMKKYDPDFGWLDDGEE